VTKLKRSDRTGLEERRSRGLQSWPKSVEGWCSASTQDPPHRLDELSYNYSRDLAALAKSKLDPVSSADISHSLAESSRL
jgi:hypothetical protein